MRERFLEKLKCLSCGVQEGPGDAFLSKAGQWNSDFGIIVDETAIEVEETQEQLQFPLVSWYFPFSSGLDLLRISAQLTITNDHAQELNFRFLKEALLLFQVQMMMLQALQHLMNQHTMFLDIHGEDENVIYVDNNVPPIDKVPKNFVHYCLECCR